MDKTSIEERIIYKMNTNGTIKWNHETLCPVLVKGGPFNRDVKNLRSHVERNTNEAVNSPLPILKYLLVKVH